MTTSQEQVTVELLFQQGTRALRLKKRFEGEVLPGVGGQLRIPSPHAGLMLESRLVDRSAEGVLKGMTVAVPSIIDILQLRQWLIQDDWKPATELGL